jgi:hypothetical protein
LPLLQQDYVHAADVLGASQSCQRSGRPLPPRSEQGTCHCYSRAMSMLLMYWALARVASGQVGHFLQGQSRALATATAGLCPCCGCIAGRQPEVPEIGYGTSSKAEQGTCHRYSRTLSMLLMYWAAARVARDQGTGPYCRRDSLALMARKPNPCVLHSRGAPRPMLKLAKVIH